MPSARPIADHAYDAVRDTGDTPGSLNPMPPARPTTDHACDTVRDAGDAPGS